MERNPLYILQLRQMHGQTAREENQPSPRAFFSSKQYPEASYKQCGHAIFIASCVAEEVTYTIA